MREVMASMHGVPFRCRQGERTQRPRHRGRTNEKGELDAPDQRG